MSSLGFVLCLALTLVTAFSVADDPPTLASVLNVEDASTLQVQLDDGNFATLQLSGVARAAPGQTACAADQALSRLRSLVDGQVVSVQFDASQDASGARAATVWRSDGQNVVETLVREGAVALVLDSSQGQNDDLANAQMQAISSEVGIWKPLACASLYSNANADVDRAGLATYIDRSTNAVQRLHTSLNILREQARSAPTVGSTQQWQTTTLLAMSWADDAALSLQMAAPDGLPASLVQPELARIAGDAGRETRQLATASAASDAAALDAASTELGQTGTQLAAVSAELSALGASYGIGD